MKITKDIDEVVSLLGETVEEVSKLVENEINLAKAELTQKAITAGIGLGSLLGAAVLSIPVLVMLLMAIAAALMTSGVSPAVSYLIAAAVGAVCAGLLGAFGMQRLKPENLKPTATIQQVSRDVRTAKELAR